MKFGRIFMMTMAMVVLMKPFVPIFFYLANVEYITAYFCENKDKPMLHCNGTCYLAKKIAESKKKEQSNRPVDNTDHSMVQVDWMPNFKLRFFSPTVQQSIIADYTSSAYHKIHLGSPFRPPQIGLA